MIKLVISVLALIVGASIYPFIKNKAQLLNFFDAFVFVSIVGLVLLHLVPHSIEASGTPAIIAILLGFALPMLFHLRDRFKGEKHSHLFKWLLMIAFIGLGIHTFIDGLALSMDNAEHFHELADEHLHEIDHDHAEAASLLALGVMLHRLPVGIFTAWILMPKYGTRLTVSVIATMAFCTIFGFVAGHVGLPHASLNFLNILQAFVAGTLLHVVSHNATHECSSEGCTHRTPAWLAPLLGSLTGFGILVFLQLSEAHHGGSWLAWLGAIAVFAAFWGFRALHKHKKGHSHHHHDEDHHH